ncbi:protein PTST3, chloroplastic [Sesamum angolense]|uniref:Protein PTST3, chloroplastic n=1 Tax=Sesamum angolense TaxID=2727404 RepID=A0AAE1WMZ1_9LAMI|nr:protein PTST3, chloroplastic [Sesamum angolense]
MATLFHFPVSHTLSSRRRSFSFHLPLPNSHISNRQNCRYSTVFASSIKKSPRFLGLLVFSDVWGILVSTRVVFRASRKVKSDADLCNDIREFLSSVGLPENHVPTMKELLHHGRQDLANVVRRRGYKFIKELLATSSVEKFTGSSIDTGQTGLMEVLVDLENDKLKVLSDDVLSNENIQGEEFRGCMETDEQFKPDEQSSVAAESRTLSFQEKVARFIQHGELDKIEDSGSGVTIEKQAEEAERNIESEDSHEPEYGSSYHEQKNLMLCITSGAETLNGNFPSSVQKVEDPALENSISSYISTEQQTSNGRGQDVNDEKVENQAEITRLKFLLHQKELELTQLKQQIENEKLALSVLQSKAETEISKAQKLISEKEIELHAAEETLYGLKESNGNLKLTVLAKFVRISQLWRAVLWLYPGVYEIKFVVDGVWRIDPQRESISRSSVHNNILRVDR